MLHCDKKDYVADPGWINHNHPLLMAKTVSRQGFSFLRKISTHFQNCPGWAGFTCCGDQSKWCLGSRGDVAKQPKAVDLGSSGYGGTSSSISRQAFGAWGHKVVIMTRNWENSSEQKAIQKLKNVFPVCSMSVHLSSSRKSVFFMRKSGFRYIYALVYSHKEIVLADKKSIC